MIYSNNIKIIECPRDAMQGLHDFIPTEKKVLYINKLLKAGFDTLDFGSFVSHKAIPQMRDTEQVLEQLDLNGVDTKLLAIIANTRGAENAVNLKKISYLGFPLSLSETFQQKNTNKSIKEAFNEVSDIQKICLKHNKKLVTYISMGFGNPYDDPYDMNYVTEFVEKLRTMGINIISLADTIGVSNPQNIHYLFSSLIDKFPNIEFGAHLHSNPNTAIEKIAAAYKAGCRRFDGAIKGFGGCPMADDELVGNIATENMLAYFDSENIHTSIKKTEFEEALKLSADIFPIH